MSLDKGNTHIMDDATKLETVDVEFSVPSVAARYKRGEILGEGGNAIVIRAFDRDLKRDVALKVLKARYQRNKHAVARFLNEARITSRLQHPGVIPVYEVGCMGRCDFFFSMKIVSGETLRSYMAQEERPAIKDLLEKFNRICATMAYVHLQGVAHRDLKPENIMLEEFDSILIMDWGIAKKIADDDSHDGFFVEEEDELEVGLTRNGEITGTPAYMSPEQTLGMMKNMDCRSDVFSLGIILYEIITGKNPFMKSSDDSLRTIFESIKRGLKTMDSKDSQGRSVPAELQAICLKCLEVVPANRYQNASELFEDFSRFLDFRPVAAHRSGPLEHVGKFFRRHLLWVLVILLVLSSFGLSYFWHYQSSNILTSHFEDQISRFEEVDEKIIKLKESLERQSPTARRILQRRLKTLLRSRQELSFSLIDQWRGLFGADPQKISESERLFMLELLLEDFRNSVDKQELANVYQSIISLRKALPGHVISPKDAKALKFYEKSALEDSF